MDVLRAAAIVWVLFYHASLFDFIPDSWWIVGFGWFGVDLFFALSGFLIAGQLLRPVVRGRSPDYGRFFFRRLLRTLPAFFVIVMVYLLFPALRETPVLPPVWEFFTFTENLLVHIPPQKALSQIWSLCVEEQFYLVLPLAVACLSLKPTPMRTGAAILGTLLMGILIRGAIWFDIHDHFFPAYQELIYYPTWARLDDLLLGVGAVTIRVFRPRWWGRIVKYPDRLLGAGLLGIVCAMAALAYAFTNLWTVMLAPVLVGASMMLLVTAGSTDRSVIARLSCKPVRALAAGAYSLYLSHKIAFHIVRDALAPAMRLSPLATILLAFPVALVLGACLYCCVERPFLKLRTRLGGPARTPLMADMAAEMR
nr:acyltransferase [Gluconacetobacter takamatsuzukensis]